MDDNTIYDSYITTPARLPSHQSTGRSCKKKIQNRDMETYARSNKTRALTSPIHPGRKSLITNYEHKHKPGEDSTGLKNKTSQVTRSVVRPSTRPSTRPVLYLYPSICPTGPWLRGMSISIRSTLSLCHACARACEKWTEKGESGVVPWPPGDEKMVESGGERESWAALTFITPFLSPSHILASRWEQLDNQHIVSRLVLVSFPLVSSPSKNKSV